MNNPIVKSALRGGFLSVVAIAVAGMGSTAHASLLVGLTGGAGSGKPGSFVYGLNFSSSGGAETLNPGDFLTLYDVNAVSSIVPPANFTVTQALVGVTAPGTAPTDLPNVSNITFTYTGTQTNQDTAFAFTLLTPASAALVLGQFTATDTFDSATFSQIGGVPLPQVAVPEPATLGLVAAAAMLGLRRRRV